MSNKLEKNVRDPSIKYSKAHDALHKRMHFGHGTSNGWPDDLFLFADGHHWWVEFKAPGKTASPLQSERHMNMRAYNVDVSTIDDENVFRLEFDKRLGAHRK